MPIYSIFGKNTLINLDASEESLLLKEELKIYPKVDSNAKTDITINYMGNDFVSKYKTLNNNPSIHSLTQKGMIIEIDKIKVEYVFENRNLVEVNFAIDNKKSALRSILSKWKNIQFTRPGKENIGQIFHEIILVPLLFFFDRYALVHASSVLTDKNKTIVFGGTGGVGKTSLEMELCRNHSCKFISDDILAVNDSGFLFPNLAFPKIYGYNIVGNKKTFDELFPHPFSTNYLHWKLLKTLKGPSGVRRRVSPTVFYGEIVKNAQKIDSFCLLNRTDTDTIGIRNCTAHEIAKLNTRVMLSEYGVFLNHVYWHQYNCILKGNTPQLTIEDFIDQNTRNLENALVDSKTVIIDIPLKIEHNRFKESMAQLLVDNDVL